MQHCTIILFISLSLL